jgi:hypothetical protein
MLFHAMLEDSLRRRQRLLAEQTQCLCVLLVFVIPATISPFLPLSLLLIVVIGAVVHGLMLLLPLLSHARHRPMRFPSNPKRITVFTV